LVGGLALLFDRYDITQLTLHTLSASAGDFISNLQLSITKGAWVIGKLHFLMFGYASKIWG